MKLGTRGETQRLRGETTMNINLDPMPDRSIDEITILVQAELVKITDEVILAGLKSFLIQPRTEMRDWCWHKPTRNFPIWVIAESQKHDYGVAYSDYGFGPACPWGLIFLSHGDFNADYCWYHTLKDAYTESRLIEEYKESLNSR
jgi:hypothetical protein